MASSDKIKSPSASPPRRRRRRFFFVLSEFQIQISIFLKSSPIPRRFCKNRRGFCRDSRAPPSRKNGNCVPSIAKYAVRVSVCGGWPWAKRGGGSWSPSLSYFINNSKGVASPSQPLPSYQKGRHWSGLFAACRRSLACVPRSQG